MSSGGEFFVAKEQVQNLEAASKYKIMMSRATAEHAGEPDKDGKFKVISRSEILPPEVVCTDSYIILGVSDNKAETENCFTYLKTRFLRFLVLQSLSSINLTKEKFQFVPLQDFTPQSDIDWGGSVESVDIQLYDKYGLTAEERAFIEATIRPMA